MSKNGVLRKVTPCSLIEICLPIQARILDLSLARKEADYIRNNKGCVSERNALGVLREGK
jgi:hypothetical protein